jgi:hypothetical protein
MISDAILENEPLMLAFRNRFKELGISYPQLVSEMMEDGVNMDKKRLQRFVNHGFEKRITQKAYMWLLVRHGIEIGLTASGHDRTDEENRIKAKEFSQI